MNCPGNNDYAMEFHYILNSPFTLCAALLWLQKLHTDLQVSEIRLREKIEREKIEGEKQVRNLNLRPQ